MESSRIKQKKLYTKFLGKSVNFFGEIGFCFFLSFFTVALKVLSDTYLSMVKIPSFFLLAMERWGN
jgi:hypothetical protein